MEQRDLNLPSQEKSVTKDDSVKERYKNCGLLYLIQHIDIHGTLSSSYSEKRRRYDNNSSLAVTSVTSGSPKFLNDSVTQAKDKSNCAAKCQNFTVSTKVSSLYPGNDILSKKKKRTAAARAAV